MTIELLGTALFGLALLLLAVAIVAIPLYYVLKRINKDMTYMGAFFIILGILLFQTTFKGF